MNIIIYTVLFLISLYFLLKFFANIASKKISQSLRLFLFIGLVILAILFAVGGKFLLSLPLTIISLALLKLKKIINTKIGLKTLILEIIQKKKKKKLIQKILRKFGMVMRKKKN